MKIRTITAFVSLSQEFSKDHVAAACEFLNVQQKLLAEQTKMEVQTIRLALNSPEEWLVDNQGVIKEHVLEVLDKVLEKHNINFCSLGRLPSHLAHLAPKLILSNSKFNCSVDVKRADVDGALRVAKICQEIAENSEGGLGNFRFCASLNFDENSFCPFFPGSFAPSFQSLAKDEQQKIFFSIGLENGVDFQSACQKAKTISNLADSIVAVFTPFLVNVQNACLRIEKTEISEGISGDFQFVFAGIDSSLNPSINRDGSIAYGFDMLDEISTFGESGASLAAVAEATLAVQNDLAEKSMIKLCGYCGCMLPLCEDEGLAKSNLNARDLLTLSSTCGVGIDTLPLGSKDLDISRLAYLYLDACAVAIRKGRPLSVRVFPVPGSMAGDMTKFESPYLTNSKCRTV